MDETTPGKLPPHNLEAERAVLGAILLEPAMLPRAIERLTADEFYKNAHREIYGAMLRLFERSEPADVLTVTEELKRAGELEEVGGPPALATMQEEATVATQFDSYMKIIRDKATLRETVRRARAIVQFGLEETGGLDAVSREAEAIAQLIHASRNSHGAPTGWPLYDGAADWAFPAPAALVERLLPLHGIAWWGGMPKRYKSLLLLYVCLAIACRRRAVATRFEILAHPRILYVAREDGGSRLQSRRDDILAAWPERPPPGAIRFVIRPSLDLFNPAHITWLRDACRREGITMLVLDTWTALSPGADPLGAKDQAQLAAVVADLAEMGLVVVVDHSRKNRPEGQPLSSADIFGPPQKWAAAEHIVMLDVTRDGRRIEVFIESKDLDGSRLFLEVSPRGSGVEKFRYAGTVEEIIEAQRAVGDQNREAVLATLRANDSAMATGDIVEALKADGLELSQDTVARHLKALVKAEKAVQTGKGSVTRYFALVESPQAPSAEVGGAESE